MAEVMPHAKQIMEGCLKVMQAYQQVKGQQVLHEEALMTIGAIVSAVGKGFEFFMPHFVEHMRTGLTCHEDVQVCLVTVRMISGLSSALGRGILQYSDTILEILYQHLQNPNVDRKIKAAIMPVFGDMALELKGEFEKYLGPVLQMLHQASLTKLSDGPADSEDWIDYINCLREGVLDGYSSIVHGLKDAGKLHLFKQSVNGALDFVQCITQDNAANETVLKATVNFVGDLVLAFQAELTAHVGGAPFLNMLIQAARRSSDPKTVESASWLETVIRRARSN